MAGLVVGAIVNGLAFTGSGYLFKMFDKNGYEEEIRRHNLAQEKLQKASVVWEEHRKQTIDYVNLQLQKEHQSAIDFQNVDNALTLYNQLHPLKKVQLRNKPQLSDFYTPSDKMKNYEYLWIIIGTVGVGGLVYYFK